MKEKEKEKKEEEKEKEEKKKKLSPGHQACLGTASSLSECLFRRRYGVTVALLRRAWAELRCSWRTTSASS
ncbi:hypothetical protein DFQ01_12855 [Paenibacillus cellulosilyticus]|uniref:Uncharacterized protein n=1 Tax=Paenibacillus cellulosilyticus TaxID=375489 RepID=A0A2V2YQG8_9BACL|nr:hypothetical protein DFQ01_12855 [Paenibacillus cellulosilyticus]